MATTYTPNYHLGKQEDRSDKFLMQVITENMDIIDEQLKSTDDKATAAAAGLKYKGAVNYYSDLPNDAELGDAYTVLYAGSSGTVPDGTEYVWGELNGTAQWIDFSKDSYTKAEVDALLAAKQALINANNKLDPAYINYDSTHRAVSDTEKSTWNGKQSALTTAQLAAANSGITAARLSNDESNIAWNTNNGVKNILRPTFTSQTLWGMTITNNNDGTITLNGTVNHDTTYRYDLNLTIATLTPPAGSWCIICPQLAIDGQGVVADTTTMISTTEAIVDFDGNTSTEIKIYLAHGFTANNLKIKPMVISGSAKLAGLTDFEPYALPNTKITPELIELVDSGTKNLAKFTSPESHISVNGCTITVSGTVSTTGSRWLWEGQVDNGTYAFAVNYKSGTITTFLYNATDDTNVKSFSGTSGVEFVNLVSGKTYKIGMYMSTGSTITGQEDIMLCSKSAWDVSQKFVPYAMNNTELTNSKETCVRSNITDNVANNAASGTLYGSLSLTGITDAWGALTTYILNNNGTRRMQICMTPNSSKKRFYDDNGWGAWSDI